MSTYDEALERVKIEVGLRLSELLDSDDEPRGSAVWSVVQLTASVGSAAHHARRAHRALRGGGSARASELLDLRWHLLFTAALAIRAVIALDGSELSFHHNEQRAKECQGCGGDHPTIKCPDAALPPEEISRV